MIKVSISLFLLLLATINSRADAAPELIAEFGRNITQNLRFRLGFGDPEFSWTFNGLTVNPSSLSVPIGRATAPNDSPAPGYRLGEVAQIPNVDPHPTAITSEWACENCYLTFYPGLSNQYMTFTANQLFAGLSNDEYGLFGQAFVPQLGDGFAGYTLTSATLTVTQAAQPLWGMKVDLYGVAVPEPTTWLLLVSVVVPLLSRRSR